MRETDLQLLARYARQHAEDAFAEIVRRHLDLVFSVALRQVRSLQLAEEVAQSTFTQLARQVNRLAPGTILTAWLYQVTRRTAIDVVRREARRQRLNDVQSENERLSNLLAQPKEPRSDEQLRELLRLRSEVSQLRAARDLAQKTAVTNTVPAARNAPAPAASVSGDHFPRESWVFAGYTNPESALVSTAWAASTGDLAAFLNSLTAAEQGRQQIKAQRNGETEDQVRSRLSKEFGQTKSIRILERETVSDNELALTLLIETDTGRTEVAPMALERVGHEWKMAGPRRPK